MEMSTALDVPARNTARKLFKPRWMETKHSIAMAIRSPRPTYPQMIGARIADTLSGCAAASTDHHRKKVL